jgi:hypothetical protein
MIVTHRSKGPVPIRQGQPEGQGAHALLLLFVSLLCAVPAAFDLSREQAAIGLGALTVLPAVIISMRTGRLLIADPIIVVGAMWFMAVTLPVLVQLVDTNTYRGIAWYKTSAWALDTAALWMYRGWAACCVGYWTVRAFVHRDVATAPNREQLHIEDRVRVLAGIVGLVGSSAFIGMTGGQSYTHLEGYAVTSSFGMIIGELRVFAIIYIFLHSWARGRGRLLVGETPLLLAILGVQALIFVASSSKGVALQLGAAWVIGRASGAVRGNLMREFVIGVAALGFIYCTFYVVTVYREELRWTVAADGSIGEVVGQQLAALGTAFEGLIAGQPIGYGDERYDSGNMLDRLALVVPFGMAIDYTNGYAPYENAWASLATPILAFIPRDLVGEKVQFMDSGKFAELHGWEFGGLSLTLTGSIFWAWGFEGIIWGMLSIGAILAVLTGWGDHGGVIAKVLMVRMVIMMLDVGAELQPLMIGLTRTLAFVVVMLFLVQHFWGGRQNRHSSNVIN